MKTVTTLVVALALVLIGVIIYFAFWPSSPDMTDDQTNDDSDVVVGENGIPSTWQTYVNSEFDFSFRYPPEGSTTLEAGRAKVTVLGPNNTANSEITDGFTFYVRTEDVPSGSSLLATARELYEEETELSEGVEEPTRRMINGQLIYEFKIESELGPTVTHGVLEADEDTVFVVSYMISGPADRGYQDVVDMMIGSISPQGDQSVDVPLFEQVSIALLDTEFVGEATHGCDQVTMVNRNVSPTTMPLTAALEELFAIDDTNVSGHHNFIASTNDTLTFDRAVVEKGTAKIYLSGELSGLAGVCDNPRARIQIEETAKQFTTVDDVELYLDGELTELQPDGRGS